MPTQNGNDSGADSESIIVQSGNERQLAESMMQRIIHAADEDEYRDLRDQLWALGEAAIPTLRAALTSRYPRQRMAAACNLGRLSDYPSIGELIALLRDPSSRVREMALFGLGVLGRAQAIEPILDCVNDYDPDVRYRVLVALKDLQYKDLETVLVGAIKDDAYAVREQALSTLRDRATQKSLPYLLLALLEPEVKMQSLAETTLDRILPMCTEADYKKIRTVLTPRQTRLVMNYMEGRNLQEVWTPLYNHLASRLGTRRPEKRLDKYGRLLTNADELPELERAFEREEIVELMLDHVLASGSSKSLLLIGDAGTGKTAIIHEFTRRLVERDSTFKVLESNTSELMTGTRYLGDWETKLKEMTEALQAEGDVILYLTNPDDLLGAGAHSKSNESFADFFKPYLQRGDLRMIAETTDDMLKGGLSRDPGFLRCFQQIRLDPMTDAETVRTLTSRLPHLRGRGERTVEASQDVLEDVADFARSFITRTQSPGRACDLMESVVEYVGRQRHKELPEGAPLTILHSDVPRALADTTSINLELLDDQTPLDLDAWNSWFTDRLIDQDRAVDAVIDRLALVKAGLRDPKRPLSTMFLVGPTGVGKTYFAKLVAERVFGDAEHIIRFDLSEYQGRYAVEKLVGSPHDKDREGLLTEAIRQQPYCVLLLDEFEKADPDVFHLFLQVLDEGRLTDARGKTSDFRQALIMMTSNLGASRINATPLGFSGGGDDAQVKRHQSNIQRRMEEVFQPEFLNRLDHVIVFNPLDNSAIERLVDLQIARVTSRRGFRRTGLQLQLSPRARTWLATRGFSPRFGARELHRCIEQQLLSRLSQTLVRCGRAAPGSVAHVDVDDTGESLSIRLEAPQPPAASPPARPNPPEGGPLATT